MAEPPITIRARRRSIGTNLPVDRVVVHTTSPPKVPYPLASAEGKARSTALYFQTPAAGGSAHYVVDVAREEHCVEDAQVAQHAPPNKGSIGIEICGQAYYTRDQWLSSDVWPAVELARGRALELCARFDVPWQWLSIVDLRAGKRGVTSHNNVAKAFHQSDHTDPGPNFPVDEFMAVDSEVKPMYDPPLTDIVASRPAPKGTWLLKKDGAIFAIDGASYAGGANGKPYFAGREAADFADLNDKEAAAGKLYVILSKQPGGRYAYPE